MTDLQFPNTIGSSIRAVASDYSTLPPRVMFLAQADPDLAVWIPADEAGETYAERELTLTAVIHDEGYAKLLTNLPAWGDLTDRDKGAALLHAWKCDSEGDDYAGENYPAKFFDHPVLTKLQRREACQYVQDMDWEPEGPGWVFYDVHAADQGEDVEPSTLSNDEFARLYDLALDAERAS